MQSSVSNRQPSVSYRQELAEIASRLGAELDLIDAEDFEKAHEYLVRFADAITEEAYLEGRRDGSGYTG